MLKQITLRRDTLLMHTRTNLALLWVVILFKMQAHKNQKRLSLKEPTQVMFLLAQIKLRRVEEYLHQNVSVDQATRVTYHLVPSHLLRVVELHHPNALVDLVTKAMFPLALIHKLSSPELPLRKR
jgi:hypothetical protein